MPLIDIERYAGALAYRAHMHVAAIDVPGSPVSCRISAGRLNLPGCRTSHRSQSDLARPVRADRNLVGRLPEQESGGAEQKRNQKADASHGVRRVCR